MLLMAGNASFRQKRMVIRVLLLPIVMRNHGSPTSRYYTQQLMEKAMNNTTNGEYNLLTVNEASARFNLGKRTVYRLLKEGVLPKIALNQRTIRIPTEEAEAALNGLTQHSLVKGGRLK